MDSKHASNVFTRQLIFMLFYFSKCALFFMQLFHWAQKNAEYIVPLYCFDPRHYVGTYNYNLPKTGPFRLRFLLQSIRDLRNTLLNKGRWLTVYLRLCTYIFFHFVFLLLHLQCLLSPHYRSNVVWRNHYLFIGNIYHIMLCHTHFRENSDRCDRIRKHLHLNEVVFTLSTVLIIFFPFKRGGGWEGLLAVYPGCSFPSIV